MASVKRCSLYRFIDFVNVLYDLLTNDKRTNVLMLREEDDDLVAADLDSHVATDGVLHDDSDEGAHHQMQI